MKISRLYLLFILILIFCVFFTLAVYDRTLIATAPTPKSQLRFKITDIDGRPVNNAKVTLIESNTTLNTDKMGLTDSFVVPNFSDEWTSVTVTVQADGYVNTALFECVAYNNATRVVQIRIYPLDGSVLPYVAYTEIPPESYILSLFE